MTPDEELCEDCFEHGVRTVLESINFREVLMLVHPDHQPKERQQLAAKVTLRVLALKKMKENLD